jgi:hypothetical protein
LHQLEFDHEWLSCTNPRCTPLRQPHSPREAGSVPSRTWV